jgi:hypothetical protein
MYEDKNDVLGSEIGEANAGMIMRRAFDFLDEKTSEVFSLSLELVRRIEPVRILSPDRPAHILDDTKQSAVENRIYKVTTDMDNLCNILKDALNDLRL